MSLSSFLHTGKRFQVLLYNSHNLTSVICLHTVCSIWTTNRTLSGATTPGQSGPGSNDGLKSYLRHSLRVGVLPPQQRCIRCILQPQPTGFGFSLSAGCFASWWELYKIMGHLFFSYSLERQLVKLVHFNCYTINRSH